MTSIFQERIVDEWIQTYITILCSRVKAVLQTAESIISKASKAVEETNKNIQMDF